MALYTHQQGIAHRRFAPEEIFPRVSHQGRDLSCYEAQPASSVSICRSISRRSLRTRTTRKNPAGGDDDLRRDLGLKSPGSSPLPAAASRPAEDFLEQPHLRPST